MNNPNTAVSLKRVDRLKITILVDNCIEWFTKLPPGFTSELATHLSQQVPPFDERTGVPFVDLENNCCGAHGFSALIETQIEGSEPHTVLFDTGPDSRSIIRNVESLQIATEKVQRIIISHWHSDHSGGLLAFLQHRAQSVKASGQERDGTADAPQVIVDVHPDKPIARGIAPPSVGKIIGRLPEDPSFESITAAGGIVETHTEGHTVADSTVFVSGEIPRVTSYEAGLLGGVRWVEIEQAQGKWIKEEHIMEERYALIDVLGKGLVIFSACSHAGIVNVVKDAVQRFQRPIYMVIGGLHLGGPELKGRIAPTVNFLSEQLRPSPLYVLPMHCSGFGVKVALEHALGEGCVTAGVGINAVIIGNGEDERFMIAPCIQE